MDDAGLTRVSGPTWTIGERKRKTERGRLSSAFDARPRRKRTRFEATITTAPAENERRNVLAMPAGYIGRAFHISSLCPFFLFFLPFFHCPVSIDLECAPGILLDYGDTGILTAELSSIRPYSCLYGGTSITWEPREPPHVSRFRSFSSDPLVKTSINRDARLALSRFIRHAVKRVALQAARSLHVRAYLHGET